jgi:hypothetical protein
MRIETQTTSQITTQPSANAETNRVGDIRTGRSKKHERKLAEDKWYRERNKEARSISHHHQNPVALWQKRLFIAIVRKEKTKGVPSQITQDRPVELQLLIVKVVGSVALCLGLPVVPVTLRLGESSLEVGDARL